MATKTATAKKASAPKSAPKPDDIDGIDAKASAPAKKASVKKPATKKAVTSKAAPKKAKATEQTTQAAPKKRAATKKATADEAPWGSPWPSACTSWLPCGIPSLPSLASL